MRIDTSFAIGERVRMNYPLVYSEELTITKALAGASIARYGDGELRLMHNEKHIAQKCDKNLAAELRDILRNGKSLVCIPNPVAGNGKPVMWGETRYGGPRFTELYDMNRHYGSAFICRPDSAPWIDNEGYWQRVASLWDDKEVTLVIGTRGGSLTMLPRAKRVRTIFGPESSAYEAVDKLMDEVGTPDHTVLICLGPAATVMAERLACKGVHALDLGHMGRFMPQRFLQPLSSGHFPMSRGDTVA